MNRINNMGRPFPGMQQGRLLNAQAQSPDEYFSGPAMSISAWAPILMADGSVRIAFAEQVFGDGKQHFRTAIQMPKPVFDLIVASLVKFQESLATQQQPQKDVPDAREAS